MPMLSLTEQLIKDRTNLSQLILKIGIAGEFIGHGLLAISGKQDWIRWISELTGASHSTATTLLLLIGISDVLVALVVLIRPLPIVLLWATFWGFWTALVRPMVGQSILDFVERSANWAAPLSLLLLMGWPKNWREWVKW